MILNVIDLWKWDSYPKLGSSTHSAHFLSLSRLCPQFHGILMLERKCTE